MAFDIRAEFMVDHLFIHRYNSSFFATWQETDHEGVKTYFALFMNGSVKPEWEYSFRVPDPSNPVMDGTDAYISALGMVGKLNISDGKFYWKYDSLYNQLNGAYKSFEPAQVFPDRAVFIDRPIPGKRPKRDTIVIELKEGNRIR
jgi:hypothetical protein